jgi:hypothetical protein
MKLLTNINHTLNKLFLTIKEFKKTAYHHYGKNPSSLLKFIYYSLFRINTFYIVGIDFAKKDLPKQNLDPDYRVIKPSLDELEKIRACLNLPREFYYDKIYNLKTCYLAFKNDELAYIHWVLFKGDHNRFLKLSNNVAELNYNTTLKKFRGNKLMAKMIIYICEDLKKNGYAKVVGVAHQLNKPSISATEFAGWEKLGKIKAIGPLNLKVKI